GKDGIENYILAGNTGATTTFTVNSNELSVNVTASSVVATDETIDVNGLVVDGTYALGAGTNVIEMASGASTAGATISASSGSWKFVLDAGVLAVTVASDQLQGTNAAANIDAAGFNDTVTVDTTRGALTTYILDADIKTWNIGTTGDGNNIVTSGADAQAVTFGTGNDTIKFTSAAFDTADSVNGGTGTDTIQITDTANIVLTDMSNKQSIETLLLSGSGAQSVDLGSASDTAGVRTVTAIAGTASDIDISGTALGLTVTTDAGNDTVIAGSGADNISTGAANDTIRFLSANFTSADTVDGDDGTDTIQITNDAVVDDADFTNVTFVETLLLSGSGAQDVNFTGTIAEDAGIRTITATDGSASNIDISGTTAGITVATDGGNDTVTAGSGNDDISTGDNDDTIIMSTNLTADDTINGGNNTDTLTYTDTGAGTDELDNVTNVEVITLGDATTRVVAQNALVASGATLTVSAASLTGAATLYWDGSLETDGKFSITGSGQDDSITGGAAADTISSGSGNDLIITGSGNDSVSSGSGDDTITIGTGSTLTTVNGTVWIDASSGDDTIYIEIDDMNSVDTVNGGADSDTMTLLTSGTLADTDLTNVTNIETLRLADGTNNITLETEAYNSGSGITSIVGGTGNDTVNFVSALDAERGSFSVDFSSGGTDTVVVGNVSMEGLVTSGSNVTLNDSISAWNGSLGADNNAVTIYGFDGGDNNDQIDISTGTGAAIGGFAENVKLTTNNLASLSTNSVIEISSNTTDGGFQISDPTNLGAVATMLDQLNNVQDGTYFIVVYDGSGVDADAYLYQATATESDGFDFADFNGATNGVDTDTLEFIGQFIDVGGDVLNSQNFI
ncbi:beta strand repeat-containing protein, partial [Pontitalea aquivivens]|uniref:beta strand repeat-containing protein n=1 Tax=Pontitalea aquivivens TaxID=3388663 RepID=UPI0039710377